MSTQLVWPEGTGTIIEQIRNLVARPVTVYTKYTTACPASACDLDPVTQTSTNALCPTCEGRYWIPTYSGTTLSGHIRWGTAERILWTEGGQLDEGDCKVTVGYSAANLLLVRNSAHWVVDERKMMLKNYRLKGIRDADENRSPNRIAVFLVEDE